MQSEDEEVVSEVCLAGSRAESSGWAVWRISYGPLTCLQESESTSEDHTGSCTVSENRRKRELEADSDDGEEQDSDGDWRPRRRRKQIKSVLNVRVKASSTAKLCGLQLWGAALLLSDYILHFANALVGQVVVELGAGPAMPGLIAARICKKVFVTDFDEEVLWNCQHNIQANGLSGSCVAKKLDWEEANMLNQGDDNGGTSDSAARARGGKVEAGKKEEVSKTGDAFGWTEEDDKDLAEATILFAADVIYSNHITDHFIRQMQALLSERRGRELILAIEKRTNFTLPELRSTSREYDHFFSRIAAPLDASAGSSFISERIPGLHPLYTLTLMILLPPAPETTLKTDMKLQSFTCDLSLQCVGGLCFSLSVFFRLSVPVVSILKD